MDKNKTVQVTLIKSLIGTKNRHRLTVRGLGLKKINQTVSLCDNSTIRGMINKVFYLLKVEE
ncbi:50S ribosomal protein L30 [Nitrosomonas sp.]|uniref:50S ribosomal protein L30 n=1 Tax=Nitrosomonas sp. TaxID=42353 RepID=UPI00262B2CB2|nr:50S ribosomal protein L30 [Nitrosomonas sp.]MCC6833676.1 50S ribosomal protein L30 [Cytophagales bacterium]